VKLVVITPHFAPDVAPTGAVITRVVEELAERGHTIQVYTALPWYRNHKIEEGWDGKMIRRETVPWGEIVRLHPFPTADKRNVARRAAAFAGFSVLAGVVGASGRRVDGVLAVSPPLSLGLVGEAISSARRGKFVFNIQDVFPDVAIELGVLNNDRMIKAARKMELHLYKKADAVTVLSDDLKQNVAGKLGEADKVHVIPNFVDTQAITPGPKENPYSTEYGLSGKTVVMYAGNVGLSQSLDMVIETAAGMTEREDLVFVINGQGASRADLERKARALPNVRFIDAQPYERLPDVLRAADIHLVPLKKGLASSSVPSKTYSILAAGRPLVASVDRGSEVEMLVERAGAGLSVPPEDPGAFAAAIARLIDAPEERERMGAAGRSFVEGWASPSAVAAAYEDLFASLLSAP
jgi:colanic acid biosynthesis glycosyl transferase WcaI